jgi:UDPglucose 6-dehydrogenase
MLGSLKGKTIGVLGLAFKPNTDDVRLSPACMLIEELQGAGATVRACDPQAVGNAKKILKNVAYCRDAYEVADGSDLLILATDWSDFKVMDLKRIKSKVSKFIDARNVFEPKKMKSLGFDYRSIGRS